MASDASDEGADLRDLRGPASWMGSRRPSEAFALPFSVCDRSRHLRSRIHKGSRASFEQPADGDTDRHGADEPHLEDLDDHRALPPSGVSFSSNASTRWQAKLTGR